MLDQQQMQQWNDEGYLILPGLYNAEEIRQIRDRFDAVASAGEAIPGHWTPEPDNDSPLKRYPRVMHPHRFDAMSKAMMLKPDVDQVLRDLLREEAVACQSMYYFKPPQSPGQALHQDNFYLAVQPGTCVAAWTAIDDADPENGGMYVVPGSHRLDIHCPSAADLKKNANLVNPPPGAKAVPAVMKPGDTLFFGGSVIHGSGRNRSETRWRRSFICHYMPASSTHVSSAYFPIFDFAGNEIPYAAAADGGPCGEAIGYAKNSYGVDAVIH